MSGERATDDREHLVSANVALGHQVHSALVAALVTEGGLNADVEQSVGARGDFNRIEHDFFCEPPRKGNSERSLWLSRLDWRAVCHDFVRCASPEPQDWGAGRHNGALLRLLHAGCISQQGSADVFAMTWILVILLVAAFSITGLLREYTSVDEDIVDNIMIPVVAIILILLAIAIFFEHTEPSFQHAFYLWLAGFGVISVFGRIGNMTRSEQDRLSDNLMMSIGRTSWIGVAFVDIVFSTIAAYNTYFYNLSGANPFFLTISCIVFLAIHTRGLYRAFHYFMTTHPAEPIITPALEEGTRIDTRALSRELTKGLGDPGTHSTAYYETQTKKAEVLKKKLDADREIAEATVKRERARAAALDAERALEEAKKRARDLS